MGNPKIQPRDWVHIGKTPAVVCNILDEGKIEVVYLDKNKAINEEAYWNNNCWEFVRQAPCGGYADNYQRLAEFVGILRKGLVNTL